MFQSLNIMQAASLFDWLGTVMLISTGMILGMVGVTAFQFIKRDRVKRLGRDMPELGRGDRDHARFSDLWLSGATGIASGTLVDDAPVDPPSATAGVAEASIDSAAAGVVKRVVAGSAVSKRVTADDALAKGIAAGDALVKGTAASDARVKANAAGDALVKANAAGDALVKGGAARDAVVEEAAGGDTVAVAGNASARVLARKYRYDEVEGGMLYRMVTAEQARMQSLRATSSQAMRQR